MELVELDFEVSPRRRFDTVDRLLLHAGIDFAPRQRRRVAAERLDHLNEHRTLSNANALAPHVLGLRDVEAVGNKVTTRPLPQAMTLRPLASSLSARP